MAHIPERRRLVVAVSFAVSIAVGAFMIALGQQEENQGTSTDPVGQGEDLYGRTCAACHQPDGQGVEGAFPALAGNGFVLAQPPDPAIQVVLTGRGGMPRFADSFSDTQIAAILSYVRQAWENDAPAVSAEQVKGVRQQLAGETEDAEGGGQGDGEDGDDGSRDDQGDDEQGGDDQGDDQDTQNGDGN